MQQIVQGRVVYAPIWELAFLNGVGPRVQESGLDLISGHAYSAPYQDVTLKGKWPADDEARRDLTPALFTS
jgi:peptide/nickel transport system substrate-binding protein